MTFSIRLRQSRARECPITTGNEGLSQPRKYEKPDMLSSNGRRLLFHFDRKASVNKGKDEWRDGKVSCGFIRSPVQPQLSDYMNSPRIHLDPASLASLASSSLIIAPSALVSCSRHEIYLLETLGGICGIGGNTDDSPGPGNS